MGDAKAGHFGRMQRLPTACEAERFPGASTHGK